EKLERSHAGIAREAEHGASQRFQMRSHLAQGRSNVVGRLVPEFEKMRTDERPILDAVWRRWNRQVTSIQIGGEILHPFHGTQTKPGRRPDDDAEINRGENIGFKATATAKKPGKEIKDRI